MPASVHIASDRLPVDETARQRLLARYFQRQDLQLQRNAEGWQLETRWTRNPDYYIDPALADGLASWPETLTTATIPLAVRQDQGFLLGLNDCWSLLSWSLRLQAWRAAGDVPRRINLFHLDSHTDLGSPRLSLHDDEQWRDLLDGRSFDLFEPNSVAAAMFSGAIGIGSFICPLAVAGITIDILHLSPARHFRFEPDQYDLALTLDRKDPLFPNAVRPALKVGRIGAAGSYTLSNDVHDLCSCVDKRYPVFLHIDLDYFNNRYDGSPDWRGRTERHDPPMDLMLARVDKVFDAFHVYSLDVADISVGVSPGFFPAEFWQPVLRRIRSWTRPGCAGNE